MKSLLVVFALMLVPSLGMAHEKPFHHVHPNKSVVVKKKVKKKVKKVYYNADTEVVVVKKKRRQYVSGPRTDTSFGIRALGTGMSGAKLGLSDYENSPLGGIGFSVRSDVDDNWAIEFGIDFLGGGQLDFYQSQVPVTLSFLHYFVPNSVVQPYLIAGGGIQFTELSYGDGLYVFELAEIVNHAGVGAKVKLGRRASFSSDIRAVGSWATLNSNLVLGEGCAQSGVCPEAPFLVNSDRFNVGVQFMAAFAYNF